MRPDSKTVIRGGYGIFFIPNYVSVQRQPLHDILNAATSNFYNTNDHGVSPAATSTQILALSNPCGGTLVCTGAGPFNSGNVAAGQPVAGQGANVIRQ